MHYDIPGREDPTRVVLYRDSREVVFRLPYPADGPDADLLARHPLVRLVADTEADKGPDTTEAPIEEAPASDPQKADTESDTRKPKPSRKEV